MADDRLGIPWTVPTLLTLGNLVCGLGAIVVAAGLATPAGSSLEVAAWLILAAVCLDGLDGAVARRGGDASLFGTHLDSLADMVSFGAAPAVMIIVGLGPNGLLALPVAVSYCCGAALRLARFTTEPAGPGFSGMPSPAAALAIAGLTTTVAEVPTARWPWAAACVLAVVVSGLMLSRARFPRPAALGARLIPMVAGLLLLLFLRGTSAALLVATAGYLAWAAIVAFRPPVDARRRS